MGTTLALRQVNLPAAAQIEESQTNVEEIREHSLVLPQQWVPDIHVVPLYPIHFLRLLRIRAVIQIH